MGCAMGWHGRNRSPASFSSAAASIDRVLHLATASRSAARSTFPFLGVLARVVRLELPPSSGRPIDGGAEGVGMGGGPGRGSRRGALVPAAPPRRVAGRRPRRQGGPARPRRRRRRCRGRRRRRRQCRRAPPPLPLPLAPLGEWWSRSPPSGEGSGLLLRFAFYLVDCGLWVDATVQSVGCSRSVVELSMNKDR
uniref:Uncharacterized protein n=1 Tax=Setaria viridis TaxID=4556 RepID=A0A4U6WHI6_SETVI|nr:hypothetical protein SEVIR_1G047350v2 [Setaria viridis]